MHHLYLAIAGMGLDHLRCLTMASGTRRYNPPGERSAAGWSGRRSATTHAFAALAGALLVLALGRTAARVDSHEDRGCSGSRAGADDVDGVPVGTVR